MTTTINSLDLKIQLKDIYGPSYFGSNPATNPHGDS